MKNDNNGVVTLAGFKYCRYTSVFLDFEGNLSTTKPGSVFSPCSPLSLAVHSMASCTRLLPVARRRLAIGTVRLRFGIVRIVDDRFEMGECRLQAQNTT